MSGIFDVIGALFDTPALEDTEPDMFKDAINPNRKKAKNNTGAVADTAKTKDDDKKSFGRNLANGLLSAGGTLAGTPVDSKSLFKSPEEQKKGQIINNVGTTGASQIPSIYGKFDAGSLQLTYPKVDTSGAPLAKQPSSFGGGESGATVASPSHGASSGWGDEEEVVVPNIERYKLTPQTVGMPVQQQPVVDPNLQLTMPQGQSQFQPQTVQIPYKNGLNIPIDPIPQYAPHPQLGQPIMYSDQNLKTNISNTSKSDIKKFMNSISIPKNYDYKDSANGPQTKGGLMAQDLERSNIGKSVVINTPKGKAIDTARLTTILASVHSHRINELESKLEKALNNKFKKGRK